jgi:hypothetical protein
MYFGEKLKTCIHFDTRAQVKTHVIYTQTFRSKAHMEATESLKTATNTSQTGATASQPSPSAPAATSTSTAMSPKQVTSPASSSAFPVMVLAQHGAFTFEPLTNWDANLASTDFPGAGEDEIAFQRGETIVVIAKDDGFGDGWWTVFPPSWTLSLACLRMYLHLRSDRVSSHC